MNMFKCINVIAKDFVLNNLPTTLPPTILDNTFLPPTFLPYQPIFVFCIVLNFFNHLSVENLITKIFYLTKQGSLQTSCDHHKTLFYINLIY